VGRRPAALKIESFLGENFSPNFLVRRRAILSTRTESGSSARLGMPLGYSACNSTTPVPAALPLFATGLGVMGLFGWRRKRKNAVAIAAA
jgi:hypothetical protein